MCHQSSLQSKCCEESAGLVIFTLLIVLPSSARGALECMTHQMYRINPGVSLKTQQLLGAQQLSWLQTEHLRAERDVLRLMNFPFVVQLLTSFQDEECVYFVMEFSCGGEFFRHLKARGR
jgi:serine/threonine protein kinase